jgi:hypothetical protein
VPQTKHWESGRATIGIGPLADGARSGSGGGGDREDSRISAAGAEGVTVRPPAEGGGTGDGAGEGGVPVGPRASGVAAGFVALGFGAGDASGFFGLSSASLRRRRKNDIVPHETFPDA